MEHDTPAAVTTEGYEHLVKSATVALSTGRTGSRDEILGTGFFLAPGLIATCAHVVADDDHELPRELRAVNFELGATYLVDAAPERFFRERLGIDLALLTVRDGPDVSFAPAVLFSPVRAIGDPLWTYGHPAGPYRGGQAATFHYEGPARHQSSPDLEILRIRGTPMHGGTSGSPVVNRRTGAVCGMLTRSDRSGGAHMLSAESVLANCPEAATMQAALAVSHGRWLEQLTDEQLQAGEWTYPGRGLRAYLKAAERAAERHPYSDVFVTTTPGSRARRSLPSLSSVYVYQFASGHNGTTHEDASATDLVAIPADRILDQPQDSLLIGEAGGGKSSLLRAAVKESAIRWARDTDHSVPVRVDAVRLLQPDTLPQIIADSANQDLAAVGAVRNWPPSFFAEPPIPGVSWLVLVDGLDEIVESQRREAVLEKISGFKQDRPGRSHRFVIATRPVTDLQLFLKPEWRMATFRLLPFDDQQFLDFARKWFEHLGVDHADEQARALLNQLLSGSLGELFRLPLIAMMLCHLYSNQPDTPLPAGGAGVYQRFVDLLNDRLFQSGIREHLLNATGIYGQRVSEAVEELLSEVDTLIRHLAWEGHHHKNPDTLAAFAKITETIRPKQLRDPHWQQILEAVLRRSGLLVEAEGGFGFLHQSLEEFLAAQWATSDPATGQREIEKVLPSKDGEWSAASALWQHPYARFLVFLWHEHNSVDVALRRVATKAGVQGLRFLAAVAAEGIELSAQTFDLAVERLRTLVERAPTEADRRSLIEVSVRLSESAGSMLLVDMAISATATLPSRRWALEQLAARADPQSALSLAPADEDIQSHRWAYTILARQPGTAGVELLVKLAGDPHLEAVDRRWATEALEKENDPRAVDLFRTLSEDTQVDLQQRQYAEESFLGLSNAPTGRRVRARLARFRAPWHSTQVSEVLDPLIAIHRNSHPNADARVLQKAFEVAARWHSGQYRKSGDPYITHPLAVATILAHLGMDTATVVAALLHDTTEYADYSVDQIREQFGAEVASLIEGVAELDGIQLETTKAQTVGRILATTKDQRILVIKLADRLHNMRTLTFLPRTKQEQKAKETLEILAPLAGSIGVYTLQWELEDLAFSTLFPRRFDEIQRLLGEYAPDPAKLLRQAVSRVSLDLTAARIKAEVTGRAKRPYAIYRKMTEQGRDFRDIYDLVGVRILVASVRDCYAALSVIHANWRPVPGQFTDYIAQPDNNLYQSLETAVFGPTGKPVEMQIRTFSMQRAAAPAIAAD